MMHKRIFLLSLFLAVLCGAGEVALNGTFQNLDSQGIPKGWMRNTWVGYEPACTLETILGGGMEGNSFRMTNIQSARGAAFNTTFYPAQCGDTLQLRFRARGSGSGSVSLYFRTTTGEWNFQSPQIETFTVGENWRNYNIALKVYNGKAGETGFFDLSVEMTKGSELEISDFHVEQTSSPYLGSEPFPERWTLFGPVDEAFQPDLASLEDIPAELDGKEGTVVRLNAHTLDFAKLFGPGERKVGWAFAVLDSPIECGYTIGAAADWWMEYYVNGEKVLDTTETGNVEYPFEIWNHVFDVALKKGRNVLAVKVKTGSTSSVLMTGGPLELADRTVRLKLSKMDWLESFDGDSLGCTGEPERIQAYPTPGLLTLTGQAIFRTRDTLDITPVNASLFPLPADKVYYRSVAVRIQEFPESAESTLALQLQEVDGCRLALEVKSIPGQEELELALVQDGQTLATRTMPKASLPADFLFGVNAGGRVSANANSLSDGSQLSFSLDSIFGQANSGQIAPALVLTAAAQTAQVTVDNFAVGLAVEQGGVSPVPYKVNPRKTFDPEEEGWELVYADEFDGEELDMEEWVHSWSSLPERVSVHDGSLEIRTDWDAGHTTLRTGAIKSKRFFQYGYFEARCKFRQEPGWWSAFWLYGASNANPFYDGFEIDVYEDYYLTRPDENGKPYPGSPAFRSVLDHNLHVYCGETLKSWNYNSPKADFMDGFHRIGVIWTPFEISYYLDGKLIKSSSNHSPYDSVTFDAFYHCAGMSPLQLILSGQVKPSAGRAEYGNYPESFYTDYVRVYALPRSEYPKVEWSSTPEGSQAKYGDSLSFSASVEPGDSPVMAAYLFDSGYLLDYKTEPPYDFQVSLTNEYYNITDYTRPGRQSVVPKFEENFHCYSVFVQDEKGNIAHTRPFVLANIIPASQGRESTPYGGAPQVIPGTLKLGDYDEGGQRVAYLDTTPGNNFQKENPLREGDVDVGRDGTIGFVQMGEWIKYTVDVQEPGKYAATLDYGTPIPYDEQIFLFIDDQPREAGVFTLRSQGAVNHTLDKATTITMELPAGRHVLKMVFLAAANVRTIQFEKLSE
ncbi:MAG: family 16 glycosylhydrolase [Oligosphaeraceae bacterium]